MTNNALSEFDGEHRLSFALYREAPWYWARFISPKLSQLMVRNPYLDNDLVNLVYRAPERGFDGTAFQLRVIAANNPKLLKITTDQGYGGTSFPVFSKLEKLRYHLFGIADKALEPTHKL